MARRLFHFGVAASGLILIVVLVLWPRSCFVADKWWVRNVKPIDSPPLPPIDLPQWPQMPQMPDRTGIDPSRWSAGTALASYRGLVLVSLGKFVPSFFSGRIRTERLTKLQRPLWLPMHDGFQLNTVPYWCIAMAAAILPAIWLYRTREQRVSRATFRFGIRNLLALTAMCALALTGYVHLGTGGVIMVLAAALASLAGLALLRRPSANGGTSTVAQRVFGIGLVCVAVYLAYLFVDCYVYYRAWAAYNSMGS